MDDMDTPVAQQPHAAIGELNKVHAPHSIAGLCISDYAPQVRRAVADAGRWATLPHANLKEARALLASLLLVTMGAVALAADVAPTRQHEVREISSTISIKDKETFDFQSLGPQEFLSHLETLKQPIFMVWATHIGWLKPSDIPWLLSQVKSDKPCASVMAIYSQVAPSYPSTIGNEAVFLLCSIREGRFPPHGESVGALNSRQRTELLEWAAAKVKK